MGSKHTHAGIEAELQPFRLHNLAVLADARTGHAPERLRCGGDARAREQVHQTAAATEEYRAAGKVEEGGAS